MKRKYISYLLCLFVLGITSLGNAQGDIQDYCSNVVGRKVINTETHVNRDHVTISSDTPFDGFDNQCFPSYKWVGDNFCNINVRVDNPCSQTVFFYIVLNNATGPNSIRCFYVNPGSFIIQPINWCDGATFYWGRCPI